MAIRPLSEFDHFRMSRWRNRFKSATLKEVATDWRGNRRLWGIQTAIEGGAG